MSSLPARGLLWISGLAAFLLLLILVATYRDHADLAAQQALRLGNSRFEQGKYEQALDLYATGLASSPGHPELNFNAAQAAYLLGQAEQAIEHYQRSENSVGKFLNMGNAGFWLGQASSEPDQQLRYYARALQSYQDGMLVYPQNMQLKFNYEFVQRSMEILEQEQADQSSQNPPAAGDGSQEVMSQGRQGRAGSGSSPEENPEALGGDPEHSGQDDEQNQGEQEKSEEGGGGKDQGENDGQQQGEGQSQNNEQAELETLNRIMRIVEGQEEENLKNNQGVMEEEDTFYGSW